MEKLSFFSLRKSIFQLLHPNNHWLCWSRAVSRGRAVIPISAETMSTSTLLWPLLYMLSRLELGYITRNYTNSSPAQPRQLLRPGQRQQQSFCHYRRCLPRQPGLGCPLGPAQPGLYFVAHITAPARPGRTSQINYNNVAWGHK